MGAVRPNGYAGTAAIIHITTGITGTGTIAGPIATDVTVRFIITISTDSGTATDIIPTDIICRAGHRRDSVQRSAPTAVRLKDGRAAAYSIWAVEEDISAVEEDIWAVEEADTADISFIFPSGCYLMPGREGTAANVVNK